MKKKLNLKIYWVVTVWPKWQIIVPKDCRSEFWITKSDNFEIVMVEKTAFWIKLKCEFEDDEPIKLIEDFWKVKIWTKYQFVIPLSIRKQLNIEPWDNLIVVSKEKKWLWFIKNNEIEFLLEYIKKMTK